MPWINQTNFRLKAPELKVKETPAAQLGNKYCWKDNDMNDWNIAKGKTDQGISAILAGHLLYTLLAGHLLLTILTGHHIYIILTGHHIYYTNRPPHVYYTNRPPHVLYLQATSYNYRTRVRSLVMLVTN